MYNTIWYGAFLSLDRRRGNFFDGYLQFAGLDSRDEIISLDCSLCPVAFDIDDEGWNYLVPEDYVYGLYVDLDYVRRRIQNRKEVNLLAVVMEPIIHLSASDKIANAFFAGYDLMDTEMGVSILTNTGCRPLIKPSLKNKHGLIGDFDTITKLKKDVKEAYENEPHSLGHIFEIWKFHQT